MTGNEPSFDFAQGDGTPASLTDYELCLVNFVMKMIFNTHHLYHMFVENPLQDDHLFRFMTTT